MFADILHTDTFILLTTILFIIGVLSTKFSDRLGVPALVLFMVVGMVMGSNVLDIIYFDSASTAQMIGVFALIIILFERELQTKWSTLSLKNLD